MLGGELVIEVAGEEALEAEEAQRAFASSRVRRGGHA